MGIETASVSNLGYETPSLRFRSCTRALKKTTNRIVAWLGVLVLDQYSAAEQTNPSLTGWIGETGACESSNRDWARSLAAEERSEQIRTGNPSKEGHSSPANPDGRSPPDAIPVDTRSRGRRIRPRWPACVGRRRSSAARWGRRERWPRWRARLDLTTATRRGRCDKVWHGPGRDGPGRSSDTYG